MKLLLISYVLFLCSCTPDCGCPYIPKKEGHVEHTEECRKETLDNLKRYNKRVNRIQGACDCE